jgi:hypothetical protein
MALPEDINNEEDENDFFDIAGDVLAAPFRGLEGAFQGAYNLADYLAFDILPDYDTRFLGTSKTMAGGAVEGISQFATGFIPLFGLAGKAGRLAKAGTVTKGVVAGAATDFTFFNGQEARLSNLIQQVPELQNPVTEFLAYDGDESELEGRMKNVLEGLGLEAVAGSFIAGLKAIKNGRRVKQNEGTPEEVATAMVEPLQGGRVIVDDQDRLARLREEEEFDEAFREVGGDPEDVPMVDLSKINWDEVDIDDVAETAPRISLQESETIEAGGKLIDEKITEDAIVKVFELPNGSKRRIMVDKENPDRILELDRNTYKELPFFEEAAVVFSEDQLQTLDKINQLLDAGETQFASDLLKGLNDPVLIQETSNRVNDVLNFAKHQQQVPYQIPVPSWFDEGSRKLLDIGSTKKINELIELLENAKKEFTQLAKNKNITLKERTELGLTREAQETIAELQAQKNEDYIDPETGEVDEGLLIADGILSAEDFTELYKVKDSFDELTSLQKELDQDKSRLDELLKKKEEGKATGIDETRIAMLERRIEGTEADIRVLKDVRTADVRERVRKAEEAELQERLEELKETPEDFDTIVDRRPRPFKTYEEEAMMDEIPRGAKTLINRLNRKFPIKGADPEDAADVEKFINVIGQRMFRDVAFSATNKISSAGRYNFGQNLLQIRQSVIEEGGLKRTMIHELWHSLSRYLPRKDVTALTKQFEKEREKYIKSFGVSLEEGVDPSTLLKREGIPRELKRFLEGKYTNDNYRFRDIDEYFAEEMTDAFLKKLDEGDLAPGGLKRIAQEVAIMLKDMFASLKAKLGVDQRQKIFNDFIKQRNVTKRREGALEFGAKFKELPDFKKGKEDEFLSAIPDKFRGFAEALMKPGATPRLPQFALETGEDVIVLKDILEKYYKENPDKVTVSDAVSEVDEQIEKTVRMQAKEGEDAEKVLRDVRITQQAYREQGKSIIQNISEIAKEAEDNGYGSVSVTKLKNAFQQLIVAADVYRRIGRETAITLQARRENFSRNKIGLSETESQIEGLRNEFVNNSGGVSPQKMVKWVQEHIDPDDLDASLDKMFNTAKKAQGKSFLDMPTEYWMNSILSGPKTQMVNIIGNGLTQVMNTLEAVAGGVVSGNMDVVKSVIASWSDGEMFKEAFKFAKKAFKEQDNLLDPSNRAFEEGQRRAITGERLGGMASDSAKQSIDALGNIIRIPSRLLLTSDEFFKQLAYRRAARMKAAMSGLQQGIRDPKALSEHIVKTMDGIVTEGGRMMSEEGLVREASAIADKQGLKGKDKAAFVIDYKDKNFNPDASALMNYALDEAQYLTFTKELQDRTLGKVLQQATNKLPFLRLIVPFVRTPTNILKFAAERTPFAVLLREERQRFAADFKSGDPTRIARANGKMIVGALNAGIMIDVAYNNRDFITGGGPTNEREKEALLATGWRPYSIKIGDTYFSYQRLDPIATILGISADLVETIHKEGADFDESEAEHMAQGLVLSLTRNFTNKSYLAGIQLWADALGDPDRYVEKLGRNYAASFVPNVLSQMADYDTQAVKEARSITDAMKKKLGLRGSLDTKRNILGEEYKAEQWMGTGFINPIQMSTKKDDPILNEMASLNHAFRNPEPNLGGQIDLREYESEQGQSAYDRQLELLKSVKLRGLTLRQTLNKLIKSRNYQRLSPESEPGLPSPRIQQINSILTRFRKEARRQMLREYPELDRLYSNLTRAKAQFRGGMQREDVLELLQQTN